MQVKPTFKFFRKFHHIPTSQKLSWCLINYPNEEERYRQQRLGVWLVGTDKAIEIAKGAFVQLRGESTAQNYLCKQGTFVQCKRESHGGYYHYIPEDDSPVLRLPKYFVGDAYYTRVYSKDMINSYML